MVWLTIVLCTGHTLLYYVHQVFQYLCVLRNHRRRVTTGELIECQPQSLRGEPHLGYGAKARRTQGKKL